MAVPRLLILGGSGFVGGWLAAEAARAGREVWLSGRTRPDAWQGLWLPMDLTDAAQLAAGLDQCNPQALVNAAAVSAVDQAEREPQAAWRINVEAARYAAAECAARGIRQVFFSSDAVFSGRERSYSESDRPAPVNQYGRTKAAAESAVLEADPQAVVLRVSLILGFPLLGGSSYLAELDEQLRAGKTVRATPAEARSPIAVQNLCAAVIELLDHPLTGFLHLGCTGEADRLSLARRLAEALGYAAEQVQPPDGPPPAGRAPRHARGVLDVSLAQRILNTPQLSLEETITLAAQRPAIPPEGVS